MSKILIVDNDIDFARFFAKLLFMKGYVAEISLTGADASQLLTNFTYNLLVMAWDLPGLSGEEICRTYRSQGGEAPVIFLAFDKDIHCLEKAFEAGADDFFKETI